METSLLEQAVKDTAYTEVSVALDELCTQFWKDVDVLLKVRGSTLDYLQLAREMKEIREKLIDKHKEEIERNAIYRFVDKVNSK